jgi:hypothetical protein
VRLWLPDIVDQTLQAGFQRSAPGWQFDTVMTCQLAAIESRIFWPMSRGRVLSRWNRCYHRLAPAIRRYKIEDGSGKFGPGRLAAPSKMKGAAKLGIVSFRDIVTGSNGASGIYTAGPGFDLCTGIGVPVINNLVKTLGGGVQATVKGVDKNFNGDVYADLIWESTLNDEHVIWILKNGVLQYGIELPAVSAGWHIAGVGDFLGNGQSDLVWENTVTGEHVIWILNNGILQYGIELPAVSAGWHIAGAADFNGDGKAYVVWENTLSGAR